MNRQLFIAMVALSTVASLLLRWFKVFMFSFGCFVSLLYVLGHFDIGTFVMLYSSAENIHERICH